MSPPPSHATPRPTLRPLEVLVAGSPPPATSAEVDKAIVEVLATHAEWAGEPSGWTGLTSGKMVETMWLGCRDLRGEDVDALRERWGHCQSAVAWLSRLYRATASEDAWDAARLLLGFARTNLPTYWYSLLVSVFQ